LNDAARWWQLAAEHYARALSIHPSNPQAVLEQAGLFERQGETGPALEAYARAFRLYPAELRAAAGVLRMALSSADVVTADAQLQALTTQGVDPEVLLNLLAAAPEVSASATYQQLAQVMLLAHTGQIAAAEAQMTALSAQVADEPVLADLQHWLDTRDEG